ncbi:MAG: autotransporter outer membrane beta-barrel domain-containing protein, partial [Hyphomicrobiales bacterium]|nr:autotransporter outer membrane beta-barrel domain-containing protein [Hyphomicrobiales bacterium]
VATYQGAIYTGWNSGPWYATAFAGFGVNAFGTTRELAALGLPGSATSSPNGQSYASYAETGYRFSQQGFAITPYVGAGYIHAHIDGFTETGGFGALAVNSANTSSFQTTLGVRATSRIATASGTLIPEVRLGWSHEFLDASQKITASLVGVPGSGFTSTGILFGRDAALVGAGLSFEMTPDAKVFVDYDGRLGSRLDEHSVSGGLKVRF